MTEMLGHGPEEIQNLLVIAGTLQSQKASAQSESQKSTKLSHIILPRLQFMDVEVTDAPVEKNSKFEKTPISPFQHELETYSALPYSSSDPEAWWRRSKRLSGIVLLRHANP